MKAAMQGMFNGLAVLALLVGFASGRLVVHNNFWWLLLGLGLLIFALTWPLYRRRFERIRAVAGWLYVGLAAGLILQTWLHWWNHNLWWVGVPSGLGQVYLAFTLPKNLNARVWTWVLNRKHLPEWLSEHEQSRMQVLASGVLTVYEVTEITEHREGGLLQSQERKTLNHEVRMQGETLFSGKRKDAEEWLLDRYRAHRKSRKLPLSPEVSARETLTRQEAVPVETTSDMWTELSYPTRDEILRYSPYEVRFWTRTGVGLNQLKGPYVLLHQEGERDFLFLEGENHWHVDPDDLGLVERTEVWLRGLKVAEQTSFDAAEADVLSRYQEYRQIRGLNPHYHQSTEQSWASKKRLSVTEVLQYQPLVIRVLYESGEARQLGFDAQGRAFFLIHSTEEKPVQYLSDRAEIRWFELYNGQELLVQFKVLDDVRDYLLTQYADKLDMEFEDL
ncbi:hypothetical protein [Deinococcus roseus]|uniref:Uncharacterized protein n=1 Tax=Deinococcus roseus TaxID=392414 RepID=A0ABQ2D0E8_9DEIO|nr:hypothetical protein [Deinococcus roseus]GGJ32191.1 hypothetical protein GCM10008938_18010 [Deinococcus roseus]